MSVYRGDTREMYKCELPVSTNASDHVQRMSRKILEKFESTSQSRGRKRCCLQESGVKAEQAQEGKKKDSEAQNSSQKKTSLRELCRIHN